MTSRQKQTKHLAGSWLNETEPKKRRGVLCHECHSQIEGQPKPDHCECHERVSRKVAADLVARNHADWQETRRKDGVLQVSKSAIVMRMSARDVQLEFVIRYDGKTEKKKLQNAITEAYALNTEQADIMQSVRRFLNVEYVNGHLSFDPMNLSDAQIRCYLTCGRKALAAQLRPVAVYNLDVLATEFDLFVLKRDGNGLTKDGKDTARGLWPDGEVSGGMSTQKLDELSSHARRADGGDGGDNPDGVKIPVKAGRPEGQGPESDL